jgi:hypothetical protein
VKLAEVAGRGDELPFGLGGGEAASGEAAHVPGFFGLPGWLRRLHHGGGYAAALRFPALPPSPDTRGEANADDELAEAFLAARLLAGDLPAHEYRWAMAVLAVGDAVLHPMVVPPDIGH